METLTRKMKVLQTGWEVSLYTYLRLCSNRDKLSLIVGSILAAGFTIAHQLFASPFFSQRRVPKDWQAIAATLAALASASTKPCCKMK